MALLRSKCVGDMTKMLGAARVKLIFLFDYGFGINGLLVNAGLAGKVEGDDGTSERRNAGYS